MDTPLAAVREFLAEHSTLTLATLGPGGQVMAASLFFAADEALNLYWVSGTSSRHSRNLQAEARAAVTVHAASWAWTEIKGVQMEGRVRPLPLPAERDAAWQLYLAKFPFVGDFQAEVARSAFFRFTPRWLRLIDNAQGFGHHEELILPEA